MTMSTTDVSTTDSSSESFAVAAARSAALEERIVAEPGRFRVLTGDRPTGPLHLGHYFGTLANRVRLQRAGVEVFLVIADYQVITDRDSLGDLSGNVRELLLDYLAAGIDPTTATIFTHSAVPALNQLMLPFLSLVSVAERHRNPTSRPSRGRRNPSAQRVAVDLPGLPGRGHPVLPRQPRAGRPRPAAPPGGDPKHCVPLQTTATPPGRTSSPHPTHC